MILSGFVVVVDDDDACFVCFLRHNQQHTVLLRK